MVSVLIALVVEENIHPLPEKFSRQVMLDVDWDVVCRM
jgi:hypothetical protein